MLTLMIVALTLIPQPRQLTETGGFTTATNVACETDAKIPAEGYRLSVRADGITIVSSDAALRGRIMGGQCCNWSEQTLSPQTLQWKMWPRTCAMAEVLWLGSDKPGFENFRERMKAHRNRLIAEYVNCAPVE